MRSGFSAAVLSCLAGLVASGCVTVTIPVDEYNLARAAVDAARQAEAPRFAPGQWHKAEEAFKQGQRLYQERDYKTAQKLFIEAKASAERAENSARVTRFQSGETAP
ncbi:MAG: DUF4398 domain-containing protein [Bdellovibrionaceae bacterium]|nr:DUF4398 domain-containing protein [Pseudobdellovibrionaceae bacterium]